MIKIVNLTCFPEELDYERQEFGKRDNIEMICCPFKDPDEVLTVAKDADILLFTDVKMDRRFLSSLEKCKLIIRYGIGYDNIDTVAAADCGIIVCNAPNYGSTDVAEHALSLLMACSKNLISYHNRMRENKWDGAANYVNKRIDGRTVGIVGFGRIARKVCTRINAFGVKTLVFDPFVTEEQVAELNAKKVDLDTLLAESDFITLHAPLAENTRHMFSMNEFKKMKNDAVIINTSRGGLINEPDLVDALEQGIIGGAGLDVFEKESVDLDQRLVKMDNVILTPHVAWNSWEARDAIHTEVTENVLRFIDGKEPESIVNRRK